LLLSSRHLSPAGLYGDPESLKERLLFTEAGKIFDRRIERITTDEIVSNMKRFHITKILAVENKLRNKLETGPFKLLYQSGPFSVFEPLEKSGDLISFSSPATKYKIKKFSDIFISCEIECVQNEEMILKISHHPLWIAFIDGVPVKPGITEFAMMKVKIPAGKHLVEFRFCSKSPWAIISFFTGFALLLFLLIIPENSRYRHHASSQNTPSQSR